jgi:hypothetical protein
MKTTKKRALYLTAASVFSAGLLFAACGGDDAAIGANGDDGGGGEGSADSTTTGNDGSTPNDSSTPVDSGDNLDGDITDVGANFGDAGSGDGGDLADGGACNAVNLADPIMSDCSAFNPLVIGGAIVAGDYALTKVTDLGTRTFCTSTFTAVSFRGGLSIVASVSAGSDGVDLALNPAGTGRKSYNWVVTPAATNKSPLSIDESCPLTTTFSFPYSSFVSPSTAGSKQVFEFVAPYGSAGGTALYHFEKG